MLLLRSLISQLKYLPMSATVPVQGMMASLAQREAIFCSIKELGGGVRKYAERGQNERRQPIS